MEPPKPEIDATSLSAAKNGIGRQVESSPRYNLLIIGGGTAGIAAASAAAQLGARTAIVESRQLGGYRVGSGAMPRGILSDAAQRAHLVQTAQVTAIPVDRADAEFSTILALVHSARQLAFARVRQELPPAVDMFAGVARFTSPRSVQVGELELRFHRALIATGSVSVRPAIPGLGAIEYLTESSIFDLGARPRKLIVLGDNAAAGEFAQAFQRLGTEVHLVSSSESWLTPESPDAVIAVRRQFEQEGITLHLGWTTQQADRTGNAKTVIIQRGTERLKLIADDLLVITERQPVFVDLGLAAAGVRCSPAGVQVDHWLRTTNPSIFAAGSVCGHDQQENADAFARDAVRNAILIKRRRAGDVCRMRCTLTDPPMAEVGMSPREASGHGFVIEVHRRSFWAEGDAAVAGFIELYTAAKRGRLVGATIVGPGARAAASILSFAIANRVRFEALAETTLPATPVTVAIRALSAELAVKRRSPTLDRWLSAWHAWRRS